MLTKFTEMIAIVSESNES